MATKPLVLPQPGALDEDWKDWAQRLVAELQSNLTQNAASASGSSAGLPILDSSGRTIVDTDGIHIFDTVGTEIIDANIVNIDTSHLVDAAITTAKIANLAVDTEKLAALAVDSAKLANSAVTSTKIANLAVGSAAIANAAVGTAQIANLAVTDALIANAAVVEAKIANLAVTDAKIVGLTANKITAGTIDASVITVTNLSADNINAGSLNAARLSLDGSSVVNVGGNLQIGTADFATQVGGTEKPENSATANLDKLDYEFFKRTSVTRVAGLGAANYTDIDDWASDTGDVDITLVSGTEIEFDVAGRYEVTAIFDGVKSPGTKATILYVKAQLKPSGGVYADLPGEKRQSVADIDNYATEGCSLTLQYIEDVGVNDRIKFLGRSREDGDNVNNTIDIQAASTTCLIKRLDIK